MIEIPWNCNNLVSGAPNALLPTALTTLESRVVVCTVALEIREINSLARISRIGKLYKIARFFRLAKLAKLLKKKKGKSNDLNTELKLREGKERLMLTALVFLFFIHLSACFWLMTSQYKSEYNWLTLKKANLLV